MIEPIGDPSPELDQRIAEYAKRICTNPGKVRGNRKQSAYRTDEEIKYHGVRSEFVASDLCQGTEPRTDIVRGNDGGVDFLFCPARRCKGCITVDAKNVPGSEKGYPFQIGDREAWAEAKFFPGEFESDIFILTVVHDGKSSDEGVRVVGWMSQEEFQAKKRIKDYGYGDREVISAGQTNPVSTLWNIPPKCKK